MKKSIYLKLSQREANKKLQLSLFERYNRIKQRNCVLGYLYFPFAYIIFSIIAIISFGYRVIMLFQDIRFTPHYMKTVIEYNKMTVEQANVYLYSQQLEYKKRLSFGNVSLKEKNSIDTTFDLLYNEYKLPEPIDEKHEEVISGISNIQTSMDKANNGIGNAFLAITDVATLVNDKSTIISDNISDMHQTISKKDASITELTDSVQNQENIISEGFSTLNQNAIGTNERLDDLSSTLDEKATIITDSIYTARQAINETDNKVETITTISKDTNEAIGTVIHSVNKIATYTEKKQETEKAEALHEEELKKKQEDRKTTAYNREKGKKLKSFESALSENQIKILVDYCNQIPMFDRDIEIKEMKDILLCTHTKPLKANINKYVGLLFTQLCENKLICKTWKSVAERYKCFISSEGKILNSNDLYMANQTSGLIDPKAFDLIEECVEAILDLD